MSKWIPIEGSYCRRDIFFEYFFGLYGVIFYNNELNKYLFIIKNEYDKKYINLPKKEEGKLVYCISSQKYPIVKIDGNECELKCLAVNNYNQLWGYGVQYKPFYGYLNRTFYFYEPNKKLYLYYIAGRVYNNPIWIISDKLFGLTNFKYEFYDKDNKTYIRLIEENKKWYEADDLYINEYIGDGSELNIYNMVLDVRWNYNSYIFYMPIGKYYKIDGSNDYYVVSVEIKDSEYKISSESSYYYLNLYKDIAGKYENITIGYKVFYVIKQENTNYFNTYNEYLFNNNIYHWNVFIETNLIVNNEHVYIKGVYNYDENNDKENFYGFCGDVTDILYYDGNKWRIQNIILSNYSYLKGFYYTNNLIFEQNKVKNTYSYYNDDIFYSDVLDGKYAVINQDKYVWLQYKDVITIADYNILNSNIYTYLYSAIYSRLYSYFKCYMNIKNVQIGFY